MSYIENTLSKDEEILSSHKFHWCVFLTPALFVAVGFMLWWDKDYPFRSYVIWFNLYFLVFIIKRVIDYYCTEKVFTNKRISLKAGLIRRKTNELRNDAVENIQVKQSIMGRILDYGNLKFTGSGGSSVKFRFVAKPTAVKRKIEPI